MVASDLETMIWYGPSRRKMVAAGVFAVAWVGLGAASVTNMLLDGPRTSSTIPGAILLAMFWLFGLFAGLYSASVRVGLGQSRLVYRTFLQTTTIPFDDIVTISRFNQRGSQILRIWTAQEWVTLRGPVLATEDLNAIGRSIVAGCPEAVVKGRERLFPR